MAIDQVTVELIARCQQDSPGAFEELFALIQEDLYRWIFSLIRNTEDTEELFQECCLRIYRHLPRLKEASKFPAWVSRIVVNQAATHWGRAGRLRTASLDETYPDEEEDGPPIVQPTATDENPREAAYRREVFDEVNEAIQQLPARQRMAVLLFDVENYSIKEIADVMECSEGAVKFNIHQGRRKLRELLAHHVEGEGQRKVIE